MGHRVQINNLESIVYMNKIEYNLLIVTNALVQNVETHEVSYLSLYKINCKIFNVFFINLLVKDIDILHDDHVRLDLNT